MTIINKMNKDQLWWYMPLIPAMWEAWKCEDGNLRQAWARKLVRPCHKNNLGMMVHTCNLSYMKELRE
jgi:hypothetical protein